MKKTNYLEITGILALSLIITSTMAVSGSMPEILNYFADYERSSVEMMLSIPTASILLIIAVTPILLRYVPQCIMITVGLVMIGVFGVLPAFVSSFPLIFMSRIALGIGIGLLNTCAVTLIGERFEGETRQKLQGIRCSMETLGESALIFTAGILLPYGWQKTFWIYGFALIILILYVMFVPAKSASDTVAESQNRPADSRPMTKKEWKFTLKNALIGFLFVSFATANALRISSFIVEGGFGSSVNGSNVLSLSILSGFLGGLAFGKLISLLRKLLLPAVALSASVGLLIICFANSLFMVAAGACICGFFTTVATSSMFASISDTVPAEVLGTSNAIALVGCNIGATVTPVLLKGFGMIHITGISELQIGFLSYGVIFVCLTVITYIRAKGPRHVAD